MSVSLEEARKAYMVFKNTFEARKREEFIEQSKAYRAQIDVLVWQMYDEGMSISEICRRYGTKNRKTITDILARRPQNLTPTPAESETGERYTVTDAGTREDGAPLYTVTDTETGARVTVAVPAKTGVPITSGKIDPQWKLAPEEREDATALYHSLRTATSPAREALDRYRNVT